MFGPKPGCLLTSVHVAASPSTAWPPRPPLFFSGSLPIASLSPRCRLPIASLSPPYRLAAASLSPPCRLPIASLSPRCRVPIASLSPRCRLPIASLSPPCRLAAASLSPPYRLPIASPSPRCRSGDDSCSDSSDEDGDDDKCCMCRQDVSPPTFNPIASPIDVNPPFFPRPSPGRRRSALVPRTLRIDTAQWKYRCPGCGRLTCSLGCCKAHKAWYSIDFGLIFLLTWA